VSVAGLVRALGHDGRWTPILLSPVSLPHEGIDNAHWGNVPLLALPSSSSASPLIGTWSLARSQLIESGLRVSPSIVHLHGLWDAGVFAAMDLVRCQSLGFVISPRGMLEPWALRHKWARKKLFLLGFLKRLLARCDLWHATSDGEAESLRALGFRQPIAVIPNGVDCSQALFPQDYSVVGPYRLLYLGRLHAKKGLENLLRAWAIVRPLNWRLAIAGLDEGGYASRLQSLAAALDLGGSVEFPGPMLGPEKWRYLASGSGFVHPSFSENFGIVVAEAMAAGLPVIATVGTPWQMLPTERCGWWVHPTPETLAGAIRAMTTSDQASLRAMGARAKAYAAVAFGWNAIGHDMADSYQWLAGCPAVPRCVRFT